jgi:transposase-like protein
MNETTAEDGAQTIEFPAGFSEEQKRAVEALAGGAGVVAAAKAAGVHHSTVSRWISQGGEFLWTLRTEQGKRLRRTRREVVPIAMEAANVVAAAIRDGDVRAAMALLKVLGVFDLQEEMDWAGEKKSPTAVDDNQCGNGLPESGTVEQ